MQYTDEQLSAVRAIQQWYRGNDQYFVLAGYAGTGKTTIIQRIVDELNLPAHKVSFCTFTGKASIVLTSKLSGSVCRTLHSLLYNAKYDQRTNSYRFTKVDPALIRATYSLIVVDECSMVSKELLKDLLDTGVKILFVGDHGQLPPVGEVSDVFRWLQETKCKLETIHRQAADNPIIHLATLARNKQPINCGSYGGKVLVARKSDISKLSSSLLAADQVICGKNDTRKTMNVWLRKELGFSGSAKVGDKVIALRNNWNNAIFTNDQLVFFVNGLIGRVRKYKKTKSVTYMDFAPELMGKPTNEHFSLVLFRGEHRFPGEIMEEDVDFGYCITCHKAQGSEFEKVVIINEVLRREDHHRWLYTAITRASDKLILLI